MTFVSGLNLTTQMRNRLVKAWITLISLPLFISLLLYAILSVALTFLVPPVGLYLDLFATLALAYPAWFKRTQSRKSADQRNSFTFYYGVLPLCLASAIVITLGTSMITRYTVHSYDDLNNATFGWPLPFVRQDLSYKSPPLPWTFGLQSPLESPTHFNIPVLLFDILLSYGVISTPVYLLQRKKPT